MKHKHILPIQIRFNDIDIVGHVNNAVYQEYFDRARIEYFKDCFKQNIDWKKKGFVIAGIQVDFFSPVFLDDKISITTKVETLGEKSLNMVQLVLKEGQEEPVAAGKTVMVCFDYSKKESIEIPAEWKEMLEYFEGRKLK
ncbi:MAG: acyl-CoA thioesterase [Prolixibacteraceae bacterium]|nr:acyl-CoA thioesterase [Prolixibacteraceae bacterium]MBN2773573.1 acyl-CoA thioesterase [Prolixibacteraceae bacterium]